MCIEINAVISTSKKNEACRQKHEYTILEGNDTEYINVRVFGPERQIRDYGVYQLTPWQRLKSPAPRLFTQPFIQETIKENINESSASLAFVRWIHQWPVNSPHKWPVTWKKFPFDDVIMKY